MALVALPLDAFGLQQEPLWQRLLYLWLAALVVINFYLVARLPAGSKMPPHSCWIDLSSQRFDSIAEASELPDHSHGAGSLRFFVHGRAPAPGNESLMQNHPDQPTKPMRNHADSLVASGEVEPDDT